METGKQDSRIREQLDKLDQVPETFQFRSALVWQQIEIRSTERKKRPFGRLYVAAAAVLLLIGGVWLTEKKVDPEVTVKPPFVSSVGDTTANKDTLQEAKAAVDQPHQSIHITARRPMKTEITAIPMTTINSLVVELDSGSQQVAAALPVESLAITKTVTKPRFRIAHINELDNNSSASEIALQSGKKKPLMTTFLFSPKTVTEDIIIKENTLYVEAKQRGIFKSVQITKD